MDKHFIFQLLSAAVLIIFLLMMKALPDQQRLSDIMTLHGWSNNLYFPSFR